jgi:hypothetical protein
MVISLPPVVPRITPLERSAEVTSTPTSAAAPRAASQARSNLLGAYTGTGSYVVQPDVMRASRLTARSNKTDVT